jgi:3-phenylpropionate/trans-cinnamate dioxygenase alpha subunit
MAWYLDGFLDRREGGTEVVGGIHKWVIECNWKFAAEQFCSDQYHAPYTHASAIQVLAPTPQNKTEGSPLGDGQTQRPAWANGLGGVQFGGKGHGSAFFFTENADANVWVGVRFRNISAKPMPRPKRVWARSARCALPGTTRCSHALLAERHADLARLASARAERDRGLGLLHRRQGRAARGEGSAEASHARAFGPAGFLEQDDSENWVEVQKVLRGHKARQTDFCVQMGLGFEERREDGIPGITNGTFAETAARGFYQRWVDLMSGKSWPEIEAAGAAVSRR